MILLNKLSMKAGFFLVLIALFCSLNSCSKGKFWDPPDASKVPTNVNDRVKKNLEEGKGWSLMDLGKSGNTTYQFASSNPMWRAALEILDFLPLSNVDYSGGIVTTDWYNERTAADESIKITVRFLTNEIRADGIKIIVHKKKCGLQSTCAVTKVASALENELRVAILKKAAIYQKEMAKKNRRERPDKVE